MPANFNDRAHDGHHGTSPFEQWTCENPDLQRYPVLPFGSIVMTHMPVSQQSAGSKSFNGWYNRVKYK